MAYDLGSDFGSVEIKPMPESLKEQVRSYCDWMKMGEDHVRKETEKLAKGIKKVDDLAKNYEEEEKRKFLREDDERRRTNSIINDNSALLSSIMGMGIISGII